jgi:ribose transport system permease protein
MSAIASPRTGVWPKLHRVINGRSAGLLLANVAIFAYLSIATTDYLTRQNIINLLYQMTPIAIAGLGTALLIITGFVDLSIGSIFGLAAVSSAMLSSVVNPWLAIAIGVVIAAACGYLNGVLVWRIRISPIIITLGSLIVIAAVVDLLTQGEAVANVPNAYGALGQAQPFGIPSAVYIMIGGALIVGLILAKTTLGLHIYAIGGNRDAADTAGVSVRRIVLAIFLFNGAVAGLAGVLTASRFGTADPTYGVNFELSVITAVVLGGIAFSGGEGSIFGALLGVAFVTLINSAVIAIGINAYYGTMVQGIALIVAVGLDQAVIEQREHHRRAIAMREQERAEPAVEEVLATATATATLDRTPAPAVSFSSAAAAERSGPSATGERSGPASLAGDATPV